MVSLITVQSTGFKITIIVSLAINLMNIIRKFDLPASSSESHVIITSYTLFLLFYSHLLTPVSMSTSRNGFPLLVKK